MDRKDLQHLTDAEEYRSRGAEKDAAATSEDLTYSDLSTDDGDLEDFYVNGRLVTTPDLPDDAD